MFGNFGEMLRRAQEIGQNMKEKQEELARHTFEVSSGGGMVQMTFNGKGEALSLHIDPEIIDREDPSVLQDLVLSAMNEGTRRSQELMKEEMGKLAGGLNIPGLTT